MECAHTILSSEAVNPIALGKTRAKQYSLLKTLMREGAAAEDCMLGDRVMCVQLHGDASFTGQGIVMEGLGLSRSSVPITDTNFLIRPSQVIFLISLSEEVSISLLSKSFESLFKPSILTCI